MTITSKLTKKKRGSIHSEGGFTLIELLIVVSLLGITSAMFAVTYGATVTRNAEVSGQNILQTEVRSSLNQFVSDLRDATYGDSTVPIIAFSANSITFYSPDRNKPYRIRRVKYWLVGSALKRQATLSTGFNSTTLKWDGLGADTGTVQTIIASVQAPPISATAGYPLSGWASNQIFKYCTQSPRDMAPLAISTSKDPITWNCSDPGTNASNIKSIVARVVVSANARSAKYTYGAVATLRWNAS
jgi:prepilin-type N-terminal cleavage/methylation domain-containing protein